MELWQQKMYLGKMNMKNMYLLFMRLLAVANKLGKQSNK